MEHLLAWGDPAVIDIGDPIRAFAVYWAAVQMRIVIRLLLKQEQVNARNILKAHPPLFYDFIAFH